MLSSDHSIASLIRPTIGWLKGVLSDSLVCLCVIQSRGRIALTDLDLLDWSLVGFVAISWVDNWHQTRITGNKWDWFGVYLLHTWVTFHAIYSVGSTKFGKHHFLRLYQYSCHKSSSSATTIFLWMMFSEKIIPLIKKSSTTYIMKMIPLKVL